MYKIDSVCNIFDRKCIKSLYVKIEAEKHNCNCILLLKKLLQLSR